MRNNFLWALICFIFWSCDLKTETVGNDLMVTLINSEVIDGKEVHTYQIRNKNGTTIQVTNYGAIVKKLLVADRDGNFENIVLGFDNIAQYRQNGYYLGATIGRYANRIADGRFSLDDKVYQLSQNNGQNHLHGGRNGFNEVVWKAEIIYQPSGAGVRMTYISPDGEEGYPGQLKTIITYILDNDDVFNIDYEASTDKNTIVNLTHHGYFNLSAMQENILNHELTIFGDLYTPVDTNSIPTGEIAPVLDTPFDFTTPRKIGERIDQVSGGYTLNYVISRVYTGTIKKQAELFHSGSGRVLEVHSDAPGVQFYTGNFLDGVIGAEGIKYDKHMGLCLEPQFFPDSPNNPHFPSARLEQGEMFSRKIKLKFKTR